MGYTFIAISGAVLFWYLEVLSVCREVIYWN